VRAVPIYPVHPARTHTFMNMRSQHAVAAGTRCNDNCTAICTAGAPPTTCLGPRTPGGPGLAGASTKLQTQWTRTECPSWSARRAVHRHECSVTHGAHDPRRRGAMRGDAHGGGAWTDLGVPVRKLSLRPFQTTLRLVLAIAPSARRRHLPRRDTRHVGARSCRARCALRPAGREAHAGRRRRTKAPAVPVSRHQQRPRATTSPPSSLAADDQSTVSGHLPRREAVRHELSSPPPRKLSASA